MIFTKIYEACIATREHYKNLCDFLPVAQFDIFHDIIAIIALFFHVLIHLMRVWAFLSEGETTDRSFRPSKFA